MRGTVAKRLRREVYGVGSRRNTGTQEFGLHHTQLFLRSVRAVQGEKFDKMGVRNVGPRAAYQALKTNYIKEASHGVKG